MEQAKIERIGCVAFVEPPLLRINPSQSVIEILRNGSEVIGCHMDVPEPEKLKTVALRNLSFKQEGEMLVISA